MLFACSLTSIVCAQKKFEIKNASRDYNVKLEVAKCDEAFCEGAAEFSLYRKGTGKLFQTIKLADTKFMPEEAQLKASKSMYDAQSVIFFEDYNFDGQADLAVRDGFNGGYGGPSYQIYLFSPKTQKFVHSLAFTNLAQGEYLGMFEVNKKTKTLQTFAKSGCCWHRTEEFKVAKNKPQKVLEITEDATIPDETKVKITTKKLVNGKWRTSVRRVKRTE